ncbi:type II toxin-antitoxin system RelE/ParE family toxin [uncultured Desulfosarcina sp.]|uniref:type II toxin-antitoxin system RelE/ParE family toxin n=1 Tax=uncultured Desulfosarcina sp. TaxID=218289 RepID=UPI0029C81F27|nr:type II toxin-antitoxin system RelE/ParE family toxin [uncultured Desulfosarcina sp.]
MKFTVEFTAGDRKDLLKIHRYIVKSGHPFTAKQLVEEISKACESLSDNPERGHIPIELEGLTHFVCRQIVIKNYRIIYQIFGESVVIFGVIDGRRNFREAMQQRQML